MRVTQQEEYKDLLTAQRTLRKVIALADAKLGELSQGTRALVDVIRLKRDIRGIPDPKPQDVSPKAKRRSSAGPATPTEV